MLDPSNRKADASTAKPGRDAASTGVSAQGREETEQAGTPYTVVFEFGVPSFRILGLSINEETPLESYEKSLRQSLDFLGLFFPNSEVRT